MGQAESVPQPDVNSKSVQDFNALSKHGLGVHMFSFTPPSRDETVYIGSEVTDENDVLDVKYTVWKKEYMVADTSEAGAFVRPKSNLKVIWKPVYRFSSGRMAMVAVKSLLNQGYKMQVCEPEE